MNILYNVTLKAEHGILDEWRSYMLDGHMQAVLDTGCFTHYKLVRLLNYDDKDGVTFAAQYFAPNLAKYEEYQAKYAAELQKETTAKFGDKVVAFRTVMEIIKES